jgi:glycosyltransferase involved in cell wall biosynthesis
VIRIGSNALPVERRIRDPLSASRAPRIGFFSTAAVGKRYDVVLDAFARIAGEVPDAELVLMGDLGPAEQPGVRAINEAIARHPARSRIRLTGRLSLEEVARETAELDVYLFPMETGANTRSSTLPVALGSGIPTVAISSFETDRDLFRDGENILFATAMTGPAFAAAALRLLRDRATADRVGDGARRLYAEELSWQRIGDRLLAD